MSSIVGTFNNSLSLWDEFLTLSEYNSPEKILSFSLINGRLFCLETKPDISKCSYAAQRFYDNSKNVNWHDEISLVNQHIATMISGLEDLTSYQKLLSANQIRVLRRSKSSCDKLAKKYLKRANAMKKEDDVTKVVQQYFQIYHQFCDYAIRIERIILQNLSVL